MAMSDDYRTNLLALMSLHDRDEAHMLDWWRSHSDEQKLRLWELILQIGSSEDAAICLVARFAQVGMVRAAILYSKELGDKQ